MKLTQKQKRFVQEYLIDLNATQAAARAGYSKRTANEQGVRLLANVSIKQAIAKAIDARNKRTELTQDMVIDELRNIAFMNISNVMEWGETTLKRETLEDGTEVEVPYYGLKLKGSKDLPVNVTAGISKIKQDKSGLSVEMHNKVQALTLLGKHMGMFVERTEITGKDGGAIQLSDADRAAKLAGIISLAEKRKAEAEANDTEADS